MGIPEKKSVGSSIGVGGFRTDRRKAIGASAAAILGAAGMAAEEF